VVKEGYAWSETFLIIYVPTTIGITYFYKKNFMERVTIDKKKYVIVEEQKFEQLQQIAAAKTPPQKKLTLTEGKAHAYQLIEAWAKGK